MSEKSLITMDQIKPLEMFVESKYQPILEMIKQKALIESPTVKTKKGRDEIRSTAAKIASSKVFIEKVGKELADNERQKIDITLKAINSSRNFIKEALVYHAAEVRKPLTDYEDEQKVAEEAQKLKNEILESHIEALEQNQYRDDKQAVWEDKKRLEVERLQREADDRATKKAEADQKAEREAETRKRIQAEAETERLKQKAVDDENRARMEKQIAVDNERKLAKDEAERRENERLKNERIAREIAESKAADLAHQKQINNEALPGLVAVLKKHDSEPDVNVIARQVLIAIITGKIEHVSVNY